MSVQGPCWVSQGLGGRGPVPWAGCNPQLPCVPTEGEELAGGSEGAGFPPQKPQCTEQVKTAPEGPPAEPHCWPAATTPHIGTEPTGGQGKAFERSPVLGRAHDQQPGWAFQQKCLPPLEGWKVLAGWGLGEGPVVRYGQGRPRLKSLVGARCRERVRRGAPESPSFHPQLHRGK